MDNILLDSLRCPASGAPLSLDGDRLVTRSGLSYPVENDIPIMLRQRDRATLWVADASLNRNVDDPYRIDTLGIGDADRLKLAAQLDLHRQSPLPVDPVVSALIVATGGHMYRHLQHGLESLPIPELRLPDGQNKLLLDIGCNWGRWSIAAARRGYRVVGIDPSLGAVLAAKRFAERNDLRASFVVGDARCLPFAQRTFDVTFSYSVLQHFAREDATQSIAEAARVTKSTGIFKCQMASAFGIRSAWHIARRGFRATNGFEVRYYSPKQLRALFSTSFSDVALEIDGFFGLGIQPSDRPMMTPTLRRVLTGSENLRRLATRWPNLHLLADSLYVTGHPRVAHGTIN